MADISHTVNIDKQTRQIKFFVIFDNVRLAAQHTVAVFNCCKAIVDIPHIPMQILHPLMTAYVGIEGIEHLPLKGIIVCFDLIKRHTAFFGNLMD